MNQSFKEGNEAQKAFVKQAERRGYSIEKASIGQDINEHWDYRLSFGRVDVKAIKRLNRHGSLSPEYIWIELKGEGYGSWLYGDADLIAFQTSYGFILVNRKNLVELVEGLVQKEYTKSPELYKLYPRRNSLLTLIRLDDLYELDYKIWA